MTNTLKEEREAIVEEFYQHMLKSTPVLDSFQRASLKFKFNSLLLSHEEKVMERVNKKQKTFNAVLHTMERELKDDYSILLYDIYAMAFYRDTGIWPPGKSAPMEMYHEFETEERSKKYREWFTSLTLPITDENV